MAIDHRHHHLIRTFQRSPTLELKTTNLSIRRLKFPSDYRILRYHQLIWILFHAEIFQIMHFIDVVLRLPYYPNINFSGHHPEPNSRSFSASLRLRRHEYAPATRYLIFDLDASRIELKLHLWHNRGGSIGVWEPNRSAA